MPNECASPGKQGRITAYSDIKLGRDLANPTKKWCDGQALHEDRKGDNSKADGNNFFALLDFRREFKGESQCQGSSQAAPEQNMLMFHRDAKRRAGK
jgi:hypothetical protein